ncbi:hypothetical protein QCA50_017340 [Cerrena zonata]|uniref:F-box domain-containing protein n=1 Tax=Cerrena zonata TaxID=2478898 RepID=A0AAW0FDG1_9APHY
MASPKTTIGGRWTLLNVPPEIRHEIIENVLLSPFQTPKDITSALSSRQEPLQGWDYREKLFKTWRDGPLHVRFPQDGSSFCYISRATPLLLTNKQINEETRTTVMRLRGQTRIYELDVLVVHEQQFWPTWSFVPVWTQEIDQVDVTFRIFGNLAQIIKENRRLWSAFRIGNGSPPSLTWCFYYLLERFLRLGPDVTRSVLDPTSPDRKFSVKTLNVNITVGEGEVMLGEEEQGSWRELQDIHHYGYADDDGETPPDFQGSRVMRPEWLANFVIEYLHILTSMGYHTAKYGAILFERVGTIRVSVEGVLLHEIELGSVLDKLNWSNPGHTFGHLNRDERLDAFAKWKRNTRKLRIKRNLPVVHHNHSDNTLEENSLGEQGNVELNLLKISHNILIEYQPSLPAESESSTTSSFDLGVAAPISAIVVQPDTSRQMRGRGNVFRRLLRFLGCN